MDSSYLSEEQKRQRFLDLVKGDPILGPNDNILVTPVDRLHELRRMVIMYGLPEETDEESKHLVTNDGPCSLRADIWKLLLGVEDVDSSYYIELINKGPSKSDPEIRNDTFRIFKNDQLFIKRVPEDKLSRLLNAYVHEIKEKSTTKKENQEEEVTIFRYVQGMGILCAPLLYIMPEIDAYYTFKKIITCHCPRYFANNLEGVHAGCQILDECLQSLDMELYQHLYSLGTSATIYAFPFIMSFFASAPPLTECIRIWDVILTVGVHFNVILCLAYVVLIRNKLLQAQTATKAMKYLTKPTINAESLLSVAWFIYHRLPNDLLIKVATHTSKDPQRWGDNWPSMYVEKKESLFSHSPAMKKKRFYSLNTKSNPYNSCTQEDKKKTPRPPWR